MGALRMYLREGHEDGLQYRITDILRRRKPEPRNSQTLRKDNIETYKKAVMWPEAETGWGMCLQANNPRNGCSLEKPDKIRQDPALDFNQSVILLASDHKLSAARTVTGNTRLLFKATYLMIYF